MDEGTPVEPLTQPAEAQAPASQPVESQGQSENQQEVKRESKNARKKRERREGLPRDPVFTSPAAKSQPGSNVKPFNVQKMRETARFYAPTVAKILDGYLGMRGVAFVDVELRGIRPMLSSDMGVVTYYIDDNGNSIEGPFAEGFAFHMIVLGGGTATMLKNFIQKHRGFASFVAAMALSVQLEMVIRKNAAIIESVKQQQAAEVQASYTVKPVENPEIIVEAT